MCSNIVDCSENAAIWNASSTCHRTGTGHRSRDDRWTHVVAYGCVNPDVARSSV